MHLKCEGLLTEDELCAQLRPSSRFPKHTHGAILDLLEKFEIAYRLPPSMQRNISTHLMRLLGVQKSGSMKRESLSRRTKITTLNTQGGLGVPEEQKSVARVMVPCLLRESKPPDLEHFWPRVEPEAMQLGRIFRFVFFPPAFFSVLMARVLHTGWRLRECWRNGMLLTKRTERVLIELQPDVHTMSVAVRGPRSARELPIFLASLEAQIQHGLHVRYRAEVPCIHCLRAGSAEPFLFPLSLLEHAVRRGETVVKCRYVEAVSVYDLAPDIGMLAANSERVLSQEKLQLHERLAGGKNSSVHRATYDGRLVAAKVVNVGSPRDAEDGTLFRADTESAEIFQEFRREVWLMSGLRHPNLIQLIGFSLKPTPTLVMEYMSGGSLYERLHSDLEPLSEAVRLKIAFDIARAMEFLHR
jgi:Protein tyrosine and serine/threonine kinase/C-terminal of Roc, COR, domain